MKIRRRRPKIDAYLSKAVPVDARAVAQGRAAEVRLRRLNLSPR
jgi:hypothetical protein